MIKTSKTVYSNKFNNFRNHIEDIPINPSVTINFLLSHSCLLFLFLVCPNLAITALFKYLISIHDFSEYHKKIFLWACQNVKQISFRNLLKNNTYWPGNLICSLAWHACEGKALILIDGDHNFYIKIFVGPEKI